MNRGDSKMDIFKLIMKKFFVAILASFVFCIVLVVILAILDTNSGTWNSEEEILSVGEGFLLFFIITSIISVIGGIPVSLIIDEIMKNIPLSKRIFKYILQPTLYV